MNRRDIKTKNKIAIADTEMDNEELKPFVQRGFKESDSNGINKPFGKCQVLFGLRISFLLQ